MAKERTFPLEFEANRPVIQYPDDSTVIAADVLEIGPGRGDMLLWLAQQHRDKQFVAIEIMISRFRKLIRRVERLQLTNVRLMRGNARVIVPRLFAPNSLERIYALFPDPWPKDRHAFHRLLSVEYLTQLAETLRPGGDIVLATDFKPYADWVIANVEKVSQLTCIGSPYSSDPTLIPVPGGTYFQNLWQAKGREIYHVQIQKLDVPK